MIYAFIVCIIVKRISAVTLQSYIKTGQPEEQLNTKFIYNAAILGYLGSSIGYYGTISVFLAYLIKEYVL